MAIFSVAQTNKEDQIVADTNWEQESYREGCAYPREQARVRLKALDDELLRRKPKGWTVLGVRERTMVTRFGKVVIRRRIYRDQDGQSRIALDEHLSWESHRQASPTLTESSVSIASAVPFRMADEMMSPVGGKRASSVERMYAMDNSRQMSSIPRRMGCGRGYGRRIGTSVYDGRRVGSTTAARQATSSAPPAQTKMAHRDREYDESNLRGGVDWRNRVPNAPPDARSLGNHGEQRGQAHCEPHEEPEYELDHTGSASGSACMAKVIQLNRNGELSKFCRSRRRCDRREPDDLPTHQRHEAVSKTRVSDWAEVSVPALNGPHSYRPWAHSLHNLIRPPLLLN